MTPTHEKALTPESTLSWRFVLAVVLPAVGAVVLVRESLVELRGEVRGFREAMELRLDALEDRQQNTERAAWNRTAMKYWASALADKNESLKVPEVE